MFFFTMYKYFNVNVCMYALNVLTRLLIAVINITHCVYVLAGSTPLTATPVRGTDRPPRSVLLENRPQPPPPKARRSLATAGTREKDNNKDDRKDSQQGDTDKDTYKEGHKDNNKASAVTLQRNQHQELQAKDAQQIKGSGIMDKIKAEDVQDVDFFSLEDSMDGTLMQDFLSENEAKLAEQEKAEEAKKPVNDEKQLMTDGPVNRGFLTVPTNSVVKSLTAHDGWGSGEDTDGEEASLLITKRTRFITKRSNKHFFCVRAKKYCMSLFTGSSQMAWLCLYKSLTGSFSC